MRRNVKTARSAATIHRTMRFAGDQLNLGSETRTGLKSNCAGHGSSQRLHSGPCTFMNRIWLDHRGEFLNQLRGGFPADFATSRAHLMKICTADSMYAFSGSRSRLKL